MNCNEYKLNFILKHKHSRTGISRYCQYFCTIPISQIRVVPNCDTWYYPFFPALESMLLH